MYLFMNMSRDVPKNELEARAAFGSQLGHVRALRGRTLRSLAHAIGTSAGYLHKLEHGAAPLPSPHMLAALARELDVSYRQLFVAAGYPLPEAEAEDNHEASQRSRHVGRARGSVVRRVLEDTTLSDDEAEQLARYLAFLRQDDA